MSTLTDKEFGEITIRKSSKSKGVKISVAPNGKLRISAPRLTPNIMVKSIINNSRSKIRNLLNTQSFQIKYKDGDTIGKEHYLVVMSGKKLAINKSNKIITLTLPDGMDIKYDPVQSLIKTEVVKALRSEAKKHLSKRLEFYANQMSANYTKIRFSHASTRWGSCSSNGTISLNIALMKLPYELIDYVLIHELAHTKHLNHSSEFWREVSEYDLQYKSHKKLLRTHSPHL